MRPLFLLVTFSMLCFSDCENALKTAKSETVHSGQIESLDFPLVHLVFLKVKENADLSRLIAEIEKLKAIPGVNELEIGRYEALGDDRAMSDFDLIIRMRFENQAAYQIYQAHPIHLQLKENSKSLLSGPPVTYHYRTR